MFRLTALCVIVASAFLCTPDLVSAKPRYRLTPLELQTLCVLSSQLGVTAVQAREERMPSSMLVDLLRKKAAKDNSDPALLRMNTTIITYAYDHKHVSAFDVMRHSEQLCLRTFGDTK